MKILPSKYHCDFQYSCTQCGDSHWITQEEARVRAFKVVCYCGATLEIEPIEITEVKLRKITSTQPRQDKPKPVQSEELASAIRLLQAFGYKKSEAESKAKQVYKEGMKDEDIFKAAIAIV